MAETTPQQQHKMGTGSAGAGMTIISGVMPALGIPVPAPILWGVFGVGVILLLWSPVTKQLDKFRHRMDAPQILTIAGLAGVIIFAGAALGGVIWQWQRVPPSDSRLTDLQTQIVTLQQQLASRPLQTATTPAMPANPKPIEKRSPRDIRELLEALSDAHDLDEKSISPVIYGIENWSNNWRGQFRNGNLPQLLSELKEKLKTDVWERVDAFVEKNKRLEADAQRIFVLDHEAAKNELSRSLQAAITAVGRLPKDAPLGMEDLVDLQFKELIKQSSIAYQWLVAVRTRIAFMTNNLKNNGTTGFEIPVEQTGPVNSQNVTSHGQSGGITAGTIR